MLIAYALGIKNSPSKSQLPSLPITPNQTFHYTPISINQQKTTSHIRTLTKSRNSPIYQETFYSIDTYCLRLSSSHYSKGFNVVRYGNKQKSKYFPIAFLYWGKLVDHPSCEKKSCINWKEDHCSLSNPEKVGASCLDFEDAMDFLRLKADAIKGTLS